jgi:hypothetical protein
MGHVPILPPTPEEIVRRLERELLGRRSRFRWRRRRAYQACLALIRRREVALGLSLDEPSVWTDKARSYAQHIQTFRSSEPVELVDGSGRVFTVGGGGAGGSGAVTTIDASDP